MKTAGGYYVIVIEDVNSGKVIACASLVVEQKFIHNCSLVCNSACSSRRRNHIECVSHTYIMSFIARTPGRRSG